jgi:hypothetical protein
VQNSKIRELVKSLVDDQNRRGKADKRKST